MVFMKKINTISSYHGCYQDFYNAVAVERYFLNSIANSTTGLRFNILFN